MRWTADERRRAWKCLYDAQSWSSGQVYCPPYLSPRASVLSLRRGQIQLTLPGLPGTHQFQFLLLGVEGNVQAMQIVLVLCTLFRDLDNLHLLVCALLLQGLHLPPETLDFVLELVGLSPEGLHRHICTGPVLDERLQMSLRFALLAGCFLKGTDMFVDHTGMVTLHVAHLLPELLCIDFPLHNSLCRFSQFCIPLAYLLLETSDVLESELAILLRRS